MTAKLKIGLLTPACRGFNALDGGIASHFADLAAGLTESGHDVRVITAAPSDPAAGLPAELAKVRFVTFDPQMPRWLDRLTAVRWQLHALAGLWWRGRAAARAVAAASREEPFDVIETTSSGLLARGYLSQPHSMPVVTRVSTTAAQLVDHNCSRPRWVERMEQHWERQLACRSDSLLTHTLHHREEVCRQWGLGLEQFGIIPHGIALPPREELFVPRDNAAPEVLFVGRFEHRKGIDVLLAAIPLVLAAHPQVRFTLIGQDNGDYWQQRFRAENSTADQARVQFVGAVSAEALQAAYRRCDVFVAPSRYESFGLIYVEAMAWGKPAIGCRAGGIPEVIAENETGLLAEPGDIITLRDCILDLVNHPERRGQMGQAARARTELHFSRTMLARRSAEFYAEVAASVKHAS